MAAISSIRAPTLSCRTRRTWTSSTPGGRSWSASTTITIRNGALYPTPADHILHHARGRGVADIPPADSPGYEARRWTPAECRAAAAYCTSYLADHPDGFPPIVPPRPERPYGYQLPWSRIAAFHDACERLDIPPLTAAALALDAAFAHPQVNADEFADMLLSMVDDLHSHARLGQVIEFDIVRPDDPDAN